jgi:nucleosome binding factor SPN SPT16 subunit
MADKIAIDKNTFFNHLSNFYASWKADKRSGNTLFGGAGSIVILMGKTKSDESSFQKNNAMHVRHLVLIEFSCPYPFREAALPLLDANLLVP